MLLLFGAIQVFVVSIVFGEGIPIANWSGGLLIALFFAGVFNAIATFLVNYGYARVSAVLAGNIVAIEPFIIVLLGFLAYQEVLNTREIAGGLFIITSVVMLNKLETKSVND